VADASRLKHEKIHKEHILAERCVQRKSLSGWMQRRWSAGAHELRLIIAFFAVSRRDGQDVHHTENRPAGTAARKPQTAATPGRQVLL
jgi:hypothetical protein